MNRRTGRVTTSRRRFNYELSGSRSTPDKNDGSDDDIDKICARQVKFKRKLDLNRSNCLNAISCGNFICLSDKIYWAAILGEAKGLAFVRGNIERLF